MEKIVFDIETVPRDNTEPGYQEAWEYCGKDEGTEGLYPEFGEIAVISAMSNMDAGVWSFWGKSEKENLQAFAEWSKNCQLWIGHNIKAFDIPWLQARFMANGLEIPKNIRTFGVKPWGLPVHDTKEMWKGGASETTQAASLVAICLALGIPSPKDDISGKDVAKVWRTDPERVVAYCEKDVARTAEVYKRLKVLMGV